MSRAVAGALALLGAVATCGGAALLVRGQTSPGAALVIGSMLFMGALMVWGLRADRVAGPDPRRPFASASTRAWLGAAAVVAAMIIGFAVQRVSG